jgi:NAD-dependent DNA ligase
MLISHLDTDKKNIPYDVLKNVAGGEGFKKITGSIKKLKEYGVQVLKPVMINDDAITYEMTLDEGENIIIDGKKLSKEQFKKIFAESHPNAVHCNLTKTSKYLFVGNKNSTTSKANKARKYNVKMITYEEAIKL